jgi:hypothetical protein
MITEEEKRSTVVEISYQKLCSFFHIAETRDHVKNSRQGLQRTLPPKCRKRRRERVKVGLTLCHMIKFELPVILPCMLTALPTSVHNPLLP